MNTEFSHPSRRQLITASVSVGTLSLMAQSGLVGAANAALPPAGEGIRPFQVQVPDEALADLRRRVLATRWPTREVVSDDSQGVQRATLQALAEWLPTVQGKGLALAPSTAILRKRNGWD